MEKKIMLDELVKVANTLDKRGLVKLADRLDKVITKLAEEMGGSTEKIGDTFVVKRTDGKVVLVSQEVLDHIGTHQEVGVGSIFSGNISSQQIFDFVSTVDIKPEGPPFYPASFPGGGYELVKPYEYAMSLPDAKRQDGPPHKQEFSKEADEWIDFPVAKVATSKSIEDFSKDDATVLIFKYDPGKSKDETVKLVEENLMDVHDDGDLFALATAFPGGMTIEGQSVPRVTEWGGTDNPTWAVILPNQSAPDKQEGAEELEEDIPNFDI
ncbi:hypothetical protein CMI41_04665 [Candidatus Pacearchaeota archaeon]|nr:hypothetical protein [Candidatus Pacearchaeota archaeon]